jgi:hypothetical protein
MRAAPNIHPDILALLMQSGLLGPAPQPAQPQAQGALDPSFRVAINDNPRGGSQFNEYSGVAQGMIQRPDLTERSLPYGTLTAPSLLRFAPKKIVRRPDDYNDNGNFFGRGQ